MPCLQAEVSEEISLFAIINLDRDPDPRVLTALRWLVGRLRYGWMEPPYNVRCMYRSKPASVLEAILVLSPSSLNDPPIHVSLFMRFMRFTFSSSVSVSHNKPPIHDETTYTKPACEVRTCSRLERGRTSTSTSTCLATSSASFVRKHQRDGEQRLVAGLCGRV